MNRHRDGRNATYHLPLSCVLVGILALTGCASTGAGNASTSADDPYEPFNRAMYTFNDQVDNYLAEPISDAYKAVTPQFFQTWVFNFFNNVKNVDVITNDILQGKFSQGGEDIRRLLMNSTLGLGGLFDVAKSVGLEQNDEDFDQTFAVWGIPRGSYWVIPLVGPATTRGIPGMILDIALNPTSYVAYPVQLASLVNTRSNAEGSLKFIDEASLDPYVFTRESFLQWRASLANDGKSEPADFADDMDAEDDAAAKKTQTKGGVKSATPSVSKPAP
ncbi:MAG: VacJ family lipoprotein [Methylovulum sp.]|nr:VacJ family lipoprotein [Methylovulum sp.]